VGKKFSHRERTSIENLHHNADTAAVMTPVLQKLIELFEDWSVQLPQTIIKYEEVILLRIEGLENSRQIMYICMKAIFGKRKWILERVDTW
jgi:hypothetical protein